jgi:hypothetical protein
MIFTPQMPQGEAQSLNSKPSQELIKSSTFLMGGLSNIVALSIEPMLKHESGAEAFRSEIHAIQPKGSHVWTGKLRTRFRELAVKQATGAATGAELDEFEQLQRLRQIHEDPPSLEEVLEEFRRKRAMEELHDFLVRNSFMFPESTRNANP